MGASASESEKISSLWFGKREGGLRIAPLTWQGRAATVLYVFLVARGALHLLAADSHRVRGDLLHGRLRPLVAYKSDLLENWPPE